MSRSRRQKQTPLPKIHVPTLFAVGDAVRVRPGVKCPKFPDIPLRGWSGVVAAVDRRSAPMRFLVEWNQRTRAQMHPAYRTRCYRDDLSIADMWLDEGTLERDSGEPVAIEQPTEIAARPLARNLAEDRIRTVFGLSSDDPLPGVNRVTLQRYHRYLSAHLAFPFVAECTEAIDDETLGRYVQVMALLVPDEADEDDGLRCQAFVGAAEADLPLAMVRVKGSRPNHELVADYSYWFFQESMECAEADDETWLSPEIQGPASAPPIYLWRVVLFSLIGMAYGLVLGAMLGAVETAAPAAIVLAALLTFLGGMAGFRINIPRGPGGTVFNRATRVSIIASAGGLTGALAGAAVALLIAAYAGALVGGLLTAIVAGLLWRAETALLPILLAACVGATAGAMVQTVRVDYEPALTGGLYGAGIGAAGALLLVVAIDGFLWWLTRRERPRNS